VVLDPSAVVGARAVVEVVGAAVVVLEDAAVTLPLDFCVPLSDAPVLIAPTIMKAAVTGAARRAHFGQLL
jgi:hypothetical protein